MSLRRRFIGLAALGLAVGVVSGVLILRSAVQVAERIERLQTLDRTVEDVLDLGALLAETTIRATPRATDQWNASLGALQTRLAGSSAPEMPRWLLDDLGAMTVLSSRLQQDPVLVGAGPVPEAAGFRAILQARLAALLRSTLVFVDRRHDTLYATIRHDLIVIGALSLGTLFLLTLGLAGSSLHLNRRVLKPLAAMEEAMRRSAVSGLPAETGVERRDELGTVARAFDRVVGDLRREADEHRATASTLRARESELRHIMATLPNPVIRFSSDLRYLYVNPAWEGYMNRAADEVRGRSRSELGLVPDEGVDPIGDAMRAAIRAGSPRSVTGSLRTSQGERWFETRLIPEVDEDGDTTALLVIGTDVTERVLHEERLRGFYDSLQQAREEERRHIAREIHDNLGAHLAALRMDLRRVRSDAESGASPRERLEEMDHLLEETIADARRLATELRPGILDELGLVAAIEWHCERSTRASDVPVDFFSELDEAHVVDDLRVHVFRILQEALNNALRHAAASRIEVRLAGSGEEAVLEVVDDGVGFTDVDATGLGLGHMRERARILGGRLEIDTEAGRGTVVRLTFPVDPGRHA